jgi:prophage DNA circulation protein
VADSESKDLFEKLVVASWTVAGLPTIYFPVQSIRESGGNRLAIRERPYRDGGKVDDIGSKPRRWSLTSIFENSIKEEGLPPTKALYPHVLNRLLESFGKHETGDLVVPTRGRIRARADSYARDEISDSRDHAMVELEFVEDNEDNVDAQSFASPSVGASARRLSETTRFSAQSDGAWSTSLADLNEFVSELEAFANAPGDAVADLDQQAGIVIAATNRAGNAFNDAAEGSDVLRDPESSQTQRKLLETKDMAGRARANAQGGLPRIVSVTYSNTRTLFSIAAELGQDAAELISLNRVLDPLEVPAGAVVKVYETA